MRRDERVVLIGEDVGRAGGVYKLTRDLYDEFGPERVLDSPISEAGIAGVGVGLAMTGIAIN
jgi:pyruvate dehydrogenase E1 component beta subunit